MKIPYADSNRGPSNCPTVLLRMEDRLIRLLAPFSLDELFANAGMAVVERMLSQALIETGEVTLRVLAHGDDQSQRAFAQACRMLSEASLVEIVPFCESTGTEVLSGVDGIMVHGLPSVFRSWFQTHRIVSRLPVVQHIHSLYLVPFEIESYREFWEHWPGWPPARWIAPSICTARRVGAMQLYPAAKGGLFPEPLVIPHGVLASQFADGDRITGRKLLGFGERDFVLLSLNRLSPEKCDYRQLALAFHALVRQSPEREFGLVLAGGLAPNDEGYLGEIRSLLASLNHAPRTRILPHFDERKKPDLLAAADVFVSLASNVQESFGVALLEAQAASLPILATHWNGYPEVLPPAYEKWMIPTIASHECARSLDWRQLSDACAPDFGTLLSLLQRFAQDRDLRDHLSRSGRENVRSISWAKSARALVGVWEELLKEYRSGPRLPSRHTVPTAGQEWCPVSPVDGMATHYLAPEMELEPTAVSGGTHSFVPEPVRGLLAMLREREPAPSVERWRTAAGADEATADRLLLQLVRSGMVSVKTSAS